MLLDTDQSPVAVALGPLATQDDHEIIARERVRDLPAFVLATGIHLVMLTSGRLSPARLLAACRALRQQRGVMVLVLRRGVDAPEPRQLLDAGADAAVTLPVRPDELQARVRALLRRHPLAPSSDSVACPRVTDALALHVPGQMLVAQGENIPLTPREFRLLTYLLRRAGAVVGREELLAAVWGPDADVLPREVDSYVRLLRRKLEPDPAKPRYLLTVWARGYRYRLQQDVLAGQASGLAGEYVPG